jgi:nucleoside diphosphate kinase
MLAQWFHRPLQRKDIELARRWFQDHSAVRAFPAEAWDALLDTQRGEEIFLPVDVWGFAGGQTFLAGVPCLFFEGPGAIVSYLEPAMCRYFAPVIQATKARLMKQATPRDAEFGLRAAPLELCNLTLLLARYVGGRGRLTSNDTAEFLYPELFQSIGTIGHEMMCSSQSLDRSLAEAHYEEHNDKPFFGELVDFLTRGPVVAMVVEGPEDQTFGIMRTLIGKTKVEDAQPGSIRGDYATITNENLVHGSDSNESAAREISLWFPS